MSSGTGFGATACVATLHRTTLRAEQTMCLEIGEHSAICRLHQIAGTQKPTPIFRQIVKRAE